MYRSALLSLLAISLFTQFATAEEYVLRLEAVGYTDQLEEPTPKESSLGTIETLVQPNGKFHVRTINGRRTYGMTGELQPNDRGGFTLQIRCIDSVVTDEGILAANGKREPIAEGMVASTSVSVLLGESLDLGGINSSTTDAKGRKTVSVQRYVLTLKKSEPADKPAK